MNGGEDPVVNERVMAILDRLLAAWGGDRPFKEDDSKDVLVAMFLSSLMFADNSGCPPKTAKMLFGSVTKRYRHDVKPYLDKHRKAQN